MPDVTPPEAAGSQPSPSDSTPQPEVIAVEAPPTPAEVLPEQVIAVQSMPAEAIAPPAQPQPSTQLAPIQLAKVDDLCAKLRPDQVRAMQHLVAGLSIVEASNATGIGERTLYRWCNEDPHFAAALNLWKRAQIDSGRTQALAIIGPALKTIISAIEKGHVAAALQMVKGLGVLTPPKAGETDPSRIRRKRRLASYRKEKKLTEAETKHEVNHLYHVDSVAAWDQRLGDELADRDFFTERDENLWRRYELTLHLTEEECHEIRERKFGGPPKCPRPSAAEALAANERFSARAGRNVADHANSFLERGRLAAEAAKGREEALKVLEILRSRSPRREEVPIG